MGYIINLRKLVGNIPLLIVGASSIIVNKQREILMIKRNDNNLWGLPAGSTEINEHPELTAIREIREETGLVVKQSDLQLLHVFGGEDFFYIYPNGDQCSNIILSYFVEKFSGKLLTTTNETISAQFFPPSDLPEEIAPHEKIMIDFYLENFYHK